MKVAIFPNPFDPPHVGHMKVVSAVLTAHLADEVWLVPTPIGLRATGEERMTMCTLMVGDLNNPCVRTCEDFLKFEFDKSLLLLLRNMKIMHPDNDFSCIVGQDQADNYKEWHKVNILIRQYPFIVIQESYPPSRVLHRKWYMRTPHELLQVATGAALLPEDVDDVPPLNNDFYGEKVLQYITDKNRNADFLYGRNS